MKEITSITREGVNYTDEEGRVGFIDFEVCHQNNVAGLRNSMGGGFTDELRESHEKLKSVGIRLTFRDPPAIEFFTVPRIHFEFAGWEDVWVVVRRIKEAGWRIGDGE